MVFTPSGIVMVVRLSHPRKALGSMVVTLSGILIDVSFLQFEKAEQPIAVTPSGMVMAASLSHPQKVNPSMAVTLFGIVISVRLLHT